MKGGGGSIPNRRKWVKTNPALTLEALIAEFPPRYEHPLITHVGEEFGYVLEGTLVLQVEEEEFEPGPGDSFHIFSSTQPHTIRNETDQVGKILWVQTLKLLEGGGSATQVQSILSSTRLDSKAST